MNDHVKTTRLAPETASMAPTMVAPAATAATAKPATVHPTRPYGTAQPVVADSPIGPRARVGPLVGWLAAAVGLAALAVLVLWPTTTLPPVAPEPVAVLEIAHGAVDLFPVGAGQQRLLALEAGQAIAAGTVIETGSGAAGVALAAAGDGDRRAATGSAATGRATIRLAGGQSIRFDTDTRVRVASASALVLERGAVYVDSAAGYSGVEVRTTLGVVSDIGTQFEVRLADSALRVRVREGIVILRRDDAAHEAGAGVELAITEDGTLTRGTTPIYGPQWDWVLEAAPLPEIEGRPLRLYLDWLARENGWTLRFVEPETAAVAAATVLHGDVRGLTPVQATQVVFQSSGLGYRLEEGVFTVGPGEAGR